MQCLDCAMKAVGRDPIGVCAHCGVGVCGDHAITSAPWLTRVGALKRQDRVDPPARRLLCPTCAAAEQATRWPGLAKPRSPALHCPPSGRDNYLRSTTPDQSSGLTSNRTGHV